MMYNFDYVQCVYVSTLLKTLVTLRCALSPPPPPDPAGVDTVAVIIGLVVAIGTVVVLVILSVITVLVCVKCRGTGESHRRQGGCVPHSPCFPICNTMYVYSPWLAGQVRRLLYFSLWMVDLTHYQIFQSAVQTHLNHSFTFISLCLSLPVSFPSS